MVQHAWKLFVATAVALLALVASGGALADPPARVARLAYESGVVTFSPAGDDEWARAPLNRPLMGGDRLWVDAGSRAELQIGGAALRLGEHTSAQLLNFDDRIAQLRLTEGATSIHVWRIASDQSIEIDTPNLAFVIRRPGVYRIDVDADEGWTAVLSRTGEADVYGDDASFRLRAGEGYTFWDTALRDYERFSAGPPDALDRWASARDRRWERSVSARYVPRDLIGYEDLDEYGRWRDEPGYGHVWIPARVASGWAPYRDGHWSWVEPWGWTWVADAPWGFAVSHYGRWANLRGQWAWVPGPATVQAVYAPALVAFVGGSDFRLTFSSGSAPAVAWFPLAPREVYRPAYQASREYFTRVNTSNTIVNVTQITNVYNTTNVTKVVYANQRVRGAVVAVPAQAFVQSRPVAQSAIAVQSQQVSAVPPAPAPHVAPVRTSFLGAAPATHRPPEAALQRAVVARTPPPPRPAPVSERITALAANPGRPLAPAAAAALPAPAAAASAPSAPVKIVQAPKAAAVPTVPPPPAAGASAAGRHREGPPGSRPAAPASAAAAAAAPAAAPTVPRPAPAPASRGAAPAAAGSAPGRPAASPVEAAPRPAVPPAPSGAAASRSEPPRAHVEGRTAPASAAAAAAPRASEAARAPAAAAVPPRPMPSGPRVDAPRVREQARHRPDAAPNAVAPAAPPAPPAPAPAARAASERRVVEPGPRPAPPTPPTPPRVEAPPHTAAPAAAPQPKVPPREEPPPRAAAPEPKAAARAEPPRVEAPRAEPARPAPPRAEPPRAEPPRPAPPPPPRAAPEPRTAPPPAPAAQHAEPPHPAPPGHALPPAPAAHPAGPPASTPAARREHASEPRERR